MSSTSSCGGVEHRGQRHHRPQGGTDGDVRRPAEAGVAAGERHAPRSPYSFSGKLISLIWALELVALPGREAARTEITLAPPDAATARRREAGRRAVRRWRRAAFRVGLAPLCATCRCAARTDHHHASTRPAAHAGRVPGVAGTPACAGRRTTVWYRRPTLRRPDGPLPPSRRQPALVPAGVVRPARNRTATAGMSRLVTPATTPRLLPAPACRTTRFPGGESSRRRRSAARPIRRGTAGSRPRPPAARPRVSVHRAP